nr:unnamed protein product [Spirometra erinaceieuropaei]
MDHLTTLFQQMWRQGKVPQDFKDVAILHLYKRKGNRQLCDNHRGIPLLNITRKFFAGFLLNRLNNQLDHGPLPESQCELRRHRRTTDMIFVTRQLQEKCQDVRNQLCSIFVDLTKAFDTLHDGMMPRVTEIGVVSEAFAVTNGVKRGCVLAPAVFGLMFSVMLMEAYRDGRPGIRIAYRTDSHPLDHRWLQFQSRVFTATVHELLFADDCAINTTLEENMKRSMNHFVACEIFGLTTNTEKTAVMHQPPPSTVPPPTGHHKAA